VRTNICELEEFKYSGVLQILRRHSPLCIGKACGAR
jgi:hypothetical protein